MINVVSCAPLVAGWNTFSAKTVVFSQKNITCKDNEDKKKIQYHHHLYSHRKRQRSNYTRFYLFDIASTTAYNNYSYFFKCLLEPILILQTIDIILQWNAGAWIIEDLYNHLCAILSVNNKYWRQENNPVTMIL